MTTNYLVITARDNIWTIKHILRKISWVWNFLPIGMIKKYATVIIKFVAISCQEKINIK